MTCDRFASHLHAYLDGSLSAEDSEAMKAHLDSCADCRLLLQITKDCQKLDEGSEVPAAFSSSWREAIRKEEETMQQTPEPIKERKRPFRLPRWLAVAAALVVVVGGTLLTRPERLPPSAKTSADAGFGSNHAQPRALQRGGAEESVMYDMALEAAPAAAPVAPAAEPQPSKVIRTVSMGLATRQFEEDLARLQTILAEHGGYVEYSDISSDRGQRRYASLTLRVPSDKLDAFLEQTSGVGRRLSMTQSQEDVSERYQDIDTRLATQKAKMTRLQELLAQAIKVEDLLSIEREIADTQYQIDSLTGSLRGIDSKVSYSTVTLSLSEEVVAENQPAETLWERIVLAVKDAWNAAQTFLGDMLVFIVVILPYALAAALLIYIIYRIFRRKKQ